MKTARDRDRVQREMTMYVVGALADIQATDDIGKHFIRGRLRGGHSLGRGTNRSVSDPRRPSGAGREGCVGDRGKRGCDP